MGTVFSVAGWIGTTAWGWICTLFSSNCGLQRKNFYRVGYVLFSLLWILISLLILYFAGPLLKYLGIGSFIKCPSEFDFQL